MTRKVLDCIFGEVENNSLNDFIILRDDVLTAGTFNEITSTNVRVVPLL